MRRRYGGYGRRGRFGYAPPAAVLESTGTQVKRKSKCAGCGAPINVGETFVRLRLRKRFAVPCGSCSHVPKRAKRYHAACKPGDLNAAMGYDPARAQAPGPSYCKGCAQPMTAGVRYCPGCGHDQHAVINRGGAVPPPPKPPSAEEVTLQALVALEGALKSRIRHGLVTMPSDHRVRRVTTDPVCTCKVCSEFKTFEGIKARVLRPGTPGEGEAATHVALQRLLKMVFA